MQLLRIHLQAAIRELVPPRGMRNLERAAELDRGNLYRIMSHDMKVSQLVRIADALGVTPGSLIDRAVELLNDKDN